MRPVLVVNDANKNGFLEDGEYVLGDTVIYSGSNLPRYTAGYRVEIGLFNQLSFTALMNYKDRYMQNRGISFASMRGFWDPTASISEQLLRALVSQTGGGWSDRQNVSEFRFQSASIVYNVPVRVVHTLKAQSLQISLQGNNLGLWTQYRGRDPAVNTTPIGEQTTDGNVGGAIGTIPEPRTYTLQFRLGF
jgi:hypothetical protein